MNDDMVALIKYRLEKASNTLNDAQNCFTNATLESTVNRIYYAMFYSVNALLIANGLSSSKHTGVRSLFNREIINKGLIGKSLGKFYGDMFNNRQEGDYKDFVSFNREDVGVWLKDAEKFIENIAKLTLEIMSKSS